MHIMAEVHMICSGCCRYLRGAPALRPVPVITLKTPGGSPTSCAMAAISRQVRLQTSEGFRMQQLPAASAGATFHCKYPITRSSVLLGWLKLVNLVLLLLHVVE